MLKETGLAKTMPKPIDTKKGCTFCYHVYRGLPQIIHKHRLKNGIFSMYLLTL